MSCMAPPRDKSGEWISAVQEISQVGRPAVPALAAELDATRRDGEQRLLILALRTSGDPRAVPALIRAIPRVSASSQAYSFLPSSSDGGAKAFLDGYVFGQSPARQYGLVTLDAGITQCIAA